MVAFERLDGDDYQIDYVLKDVNVICNQEKCVPVTWITADGSASEYTRNELDRSGA